MLEETKERYRSISLQHRAIIMALLGLIYPGYVYYEEGSGLSKQLEAAQQAKVAEEKKYQVAKKKKEDLPHLEERFTAVTEELRKAQEKLPNKFYMDDILHSTASVAKEIGIKILSFNPGGETVIQGAHQYVEMPIKLKLVGKYSQVANFFDSMVNLEKIVHLRNISLSAVREKDESSVEKVMISTDVDLVVFRSS